MKHSLLVIVKRMLAAIDAEDVNGVGDTAEADMCVAIANRSFELIAVKKRWRHFKRYDQLATTATANQLAVNSGVYALDPYNVYYNDNLIHYLDPDTFLYYTINRDTDESNVELVDGIKVYNDRDPIWFTSDDDETLTFDAYNVTQLVGSDTRCITYALPTSPLTADAEVFDLPSTMYPAFVEYCIGMAMAELQQNPDGKEKIREAKKEISRFSRNSRLVEKPNDVRKYIVPRRSWYKMSYVPKLAE